MFARGRHGCSDPFASMALASDLCHPSTTSEIAQTMRTIRGMKPGDSHMTTTAQTSASGTRKTDLQSEPADPARAAEAELLALMRPVVAAAKTVTREALNETAAVLRVAFAPPHGREVH